MKPDFDVIVVGSGPAGVSATFPLVEAGLRVLLVDGGNQPDTPPPSEAFLSAREDENQWKWFLGKNFHALNMREAISPKLRAPSQAYAFSDFEIANKIHGRGFITVGSMARGGLSNAWGCGVAAFSSAELAEFPFSAAEIAPCYKTVATRIGISGRTSDDLTDYFGLDELAEPPIAMDELHTHLSKQYFRRRQEHHYQGFKLGRSRVAALSKDISARKACDQSGNCLWGCSRGALYSASHDLAALQKHQTYSELAGFVVDKLLRDGDYWVVAGRAATAGERKSFTTRKVVLATGTLATTRIALKTLGHKKDAAVLSNPTAAFLLWLPRLLGMPRVPTFGLGQLSFDLKLNGNISAFGSTFSTTGIPVSEFARRLPMRRRHSVELLKGLLSSCLVGNLFLPGSLTKARAALAADDSLVITGGYDDRVSALMDEARRKLRKAYWSMGAVLLPGSFTMGRPGGDIHYAGTLPMRSEPVIGETSVSGEIKGMGGVYVVDGACLPILPAKSHTLTIMANADRIGKIIANSVKGESHEK